MISDISSEFDLHSAEDRNFEEEEEDEIEIIIPIQEEFKVEKRSSKYQSNDSVDISKLNVRHYANDSSARNDHLFESLLRYSSNETLSRYGSDSLSKYQNANDSSSRNDNSFESLLRYPTNETLSRYGSDSLSRYQQYSNDESGSLGMGSLLHSVGAFLQLIQSFPQLGKNVDDVYKSNNKVKE